MAVTVENNFSNDSSGAFPTPGPASVGDPEQVAKQRADLGLSDDPSGESDSGWKPEHAQAAVAADEDKPADGSTPAVEEPAPAPAAEPAPVEPEAPPAQ